MSHTCLLSAALALLLLAGSGCVSEPPEAEYFAGRLSVSGDTVRLCDCATGRTHPVVDNEMRDEAVTRYEKIVNDPPRTIVMACKGQLTAGRPDAPDSLRIDRLLSLGSDDSDRFLLVGFYECETDSHRKILHLKPDRTFLLTVFDENHENMTSGRWSQTSELELILQSETSPLLRFEILPNHETLTGNNSPNTETVFRKVYL